MKKEEIASILLLDDIKERFAELGVTKTELPANTLRIARVWLDDDDEDDVNDFVNLRYEYENGYVSDYPDYLVLSTILFGLKQLKDQ